MYSIHHSPEPAPRGRAGFTLLELLVALTISGILVGTIFQLLEGNSRFVRLQSAREEVQQNGRAALSVIASDLRSVPSGGIVSMSPTAVRFYAPRGWGILCNTINSASSTAWAIFPANTFPSDDVWSKRGWGIAVEQTAHPAVNTASWRFVSQVTKQTGGTACDTIQSAPTASHLRYGFVRPGGASFVTTGSVLPGTPVMLFEEVEYDVASSSGGSVPGYWIRRMSGYGVDGQPNMQPMAGPVPSENALRLEYFRADGVTPATTPAEVRSISIRVITRSRSESMQAGTMSPSQVDTTSTVVSLRN
jgi:prepilin-type N-terminal cleavage/methylation domain-containing protein